MRDRRGIILLKDDLSCERFSGAVEGWNGVLESMKGFFLNPDFGAREAREEHRSGCVGSALDYL